MVMLPLRSKKSISRFVPNLMSGLLLKDGHVLPQGNVCRRGIALEFFFIVGERTGYIWCDLCCLGCVESLRSAVLVQAQCRHYHILELFARHISRGVHVAGPGRAVTWEESLLAVIASRICRGVPRPKAWGCCGRGTWYVEWSSQRRFASSPLLSFVVQRFLSTRTWTKAVAHGQRALNVKYVCISSDGTSVWLVEPTVVPVQCAATCSGVWVGGGGGARPTLT